MHFDLRTDRDFILFLAITLFLGAAIAASGSVSLPMDGHEVFVVQTTQEMQERNDWIVPWFNGEPRLNKPPLNYWLTGAVAWLAGSPDHVQAWHGRLVSLLAALAMTVLTFLAGNLLYGRRAAMLAAMFLVTSLGFFNYSHDARPDMLYAMFSSAGCIAFLSAWKTDDPRTRRYAALLMWTAYALATLAKGPQLPLMYLVASIIFCRLAGMSWRESLPLFRPVTGVALFSALTLPWWYLLQHRLGAHGLEHTQLSGSLLTAIRFDQFYKLYYFYRPLLLVLPWLVFLPHTILRLKNERLREDGDKLLILYLLVPAVLLSFGSQQRWFYLLSSLPPMILLLAAGADYFLERRPDPTRACKFLMGLALAAAVAYILAGQWQVGWGKERFEFYNLARHARPQAEAGIPVFTLRVNPDVYVYYLHTRIHEGKSLDTVLEKTRDMGREQALVILHTSAVTEIPSQVPFKLLYTTQGKENKTLSLVNLHTAP